MPQRCIEICIRKQRDGRLIDAPLIRFRTSHVNDPRPTQIRDMWSYALGCAETRAVTLGDSVAV
jgi:hypothetical protein